MKGTGAIRTDAMVIDPVMGGQLWRFTGFYGESRRELRYRSWDLLKYLNTQSASPWLCAGDFNEILDASEQFGGLTRSERQMDGFRDAVDTCGFSDLGFIGLPYTWDNRQQGDSNIKVRLDRAFANSFFADLFCDIRVWHCQTTKSDHCCLMIECATSNGKGRGARIFRYENMWRRHPEYKEFVDHVWGDGDNIQNLGQLKASLNWVQGELQDWDRSVFGHVKKNLAELRKALEQERGRLLRSGPSRIERRLMAQISELLAREEELEKQRSRLTWLKDGDRNTEFFQAKSKERARKNRIESLQNEQGDVVTDQQDLEALVVDFYSNLFTAQPNLEPEQIVQHVPHRVTDDMNEGLCKPFTADEVRRALFMMGSNKAPGPDGFTAGFYQHHWDTVGPCVTRAVLNFLNGGELPPDVNSTTIVLIPKCKNLQNLKQFRPISLCNVVYKICSKVIANRLREVLDDIISVE